MADYDAIVIGSGAGGLTAAVALANAGQRVLVLEQHYIAGGWCQSFVLDQYRFSPGVHYIGELAEGQMLRHIYQGLGISGDLEFCKLNEDGYDHFLVGGERFDVPVGAARFEERLAERFPREREAIRNYFRLIRSVSTEAASAMDYSAGLKLLQLPFRAPHLVLHGLRRLGRYLKDIHDPVLRAFLVAQAGDYGLPPSIAPVIMQAAVMGHYFDGAYYPRGGAHRIPRAYIRQLKRKGGAIRLSTRVGRILLENGRAAGVELESGERLTASVVVSNADPEVTFRRLVGEAHLSGRLRRKLARTEYSIGSLALFLATDLDLRGMGYDSGNYWYYRTPDVDRAYSAMQARKPGQTFDGCFATVTTLKDPSKRTDGVHTMEVFTFVPYDMFRRWERYPYGERPADYAALKDALAQRLLRTAEAVIPGLSDHLVFLEAATPLTNRFYCEAHEGHVYGPSKVARQLGPGSFPIRTEIPGLYMVGAATLSHGVMGVTVSGMVAATKILRCSFGDLLSEHAPASPLYRSEHPEEWMTKLRQRRNASVGPEPLRPSMAAAAVA